MRNNIWQACFYHFGGVMQTDPFKEYLKTGAR